ncbi:MAG: hypothetical protein OEX07_16110 [Gammaproteobacteria bacterium]|nr:hypothetical protein [Gammaproteobacteria bacterium]
MKPVKSLLAGLALSAMASSSWAIGNIDPGLLNSDKIVTAFTEDLGAALSYKAVTPAEPLGLIGFDIGIEVTGTKLDGIKTWGAAIGNDDLGLLPLPKLHIHKGLPMGMDLGFVYSKVPSTDIAYAGGEFRYSFVSGNIALPAVAVRGTYTTLIGIDEVELTTKGVELTVSKGFLMLTPYGGIGNVWVDSSVDTGLPVVGKITGDASMFKWFVGLNLNLGLMNLVYETDTTGNSMSHSVKMGFRF